MKITVFGGSLPQPGDINYEAARKLGRLLAEAGHTVLTGGYIGAMEAVSRGASQAGGRVIGVTCDEIELWRPVKANRWVTEERRCVGLHERLLVLTDACDAAMALPGGIGTLAEIAVLWNRMVVRATRPKPLILIGEGWRQTLHGFLEQQESYIPPADKALLSYTESVAEAVDRLKQMKPEE